MWQPSESRRTLVSTKIVITVGPATRAAEILHRIIDEGADVARFNFSHGSLADHEQTLATLRRVVGEGGRPLALLGDLGGPKIRLAGVVKPLAIKAGEQVAIHRQGHRGPENSLSTNYARFVDDVDVGHRVLIDDGNVHLLVTEKTEEQLFCTCTAGGAIASQKGVNLPDTRLELDPITEFDRECVRWAIRHGLDYLALSFVHRAADLDRLRSFVDGKESPVHLIAKIERPAALDQIGAIIEASDGLMVARGDLGVEMDVAQVPMIQKDLIRRCRDAGKPVIVATQMLQSMIEKPGPTRAEVSDVANAIVDGTDAVMLSGETSIGAHPVLAVHTVQRVAEHTEGYLSRQIPSPPLAIDRLDPLVCQAALARGVWQMVHDLNVRALAVWSENGRLARLFSNLRFRVPIAAFTNSPRVTRQMALYYGVIPIRLERPMHAEEIVAAMDATLVHRGIVDHGDLIVMVGVTLADGLETLDGALVHAVGQTGAKSPPTG